MRIYYGWYVVAIAVVIYMLVIGATFAAFGLFVLPVSADLKLSRADMHTGIILMNLGNAFVAPMLGRLLDRIPAKRILITSAILLGLSLAVLGLSRSLWLSSFVLAVTLPIGYLGASSLTMSVLIARWFVANRGRAMALAAVGMSLGSVTVTPLVGLLIETQGWRAALLIMGAVLAVLVLTLALILRERPGAEDVEPGRERLAAHAPAAAAHAPAPGPAKVGALLRAPQFWSIGLSAALAMSIMQALAVVLVPLGRESGLSMMQATSLLSAMGVGAISGALLLAVIADKIDRIVLLTSIFLAGGLLNAALPYADSYPLLLAGAGMLGITSGAVPPLFFALLADRFGAPSFGTIRGLSMPLIAATGMIALRFSGEVFDRTGGYEVMFHAFVAAQLVAAALMFATRFTGAPMARGTPAPTAP